MIYVLVTMSANFDFCLSNSPWNNSFLTPKIFCFVLIIHAVSELHTVVFYAFYLYHLDELSNDLHPDNDNLSKKQFQVT